MYAVDLGLASWTSERSIFPAQGECLLQIIVVPRSSVGRYCYTDLENTFVKSFYSPTSRKGFWERLIVPHTSHVYGQLFRFAMLDYGNPHWRYVGGFRYAEECTFLVGHPHADFPHLIICDD